jgi:NADH-quinone oxidoreductase subunit A
MGGLAKGFAMSGLVGYLVLFVLIGVGFIFIHLVIGKLVRPARPDAEKQTIYECGEPTIGSAWVQFDLRFYVVALLFVIFDVEVAFFFPWAIVFGQSNSLAQVATPQTDAERLAYIAQLKSLVPPEMQTAGQKEIIALETATEAERTAAADRFAAQAERDRKVASRYAWLAFWDILVFFGVLLVGFAYLWVRGDLKWVRSLASEEGEPPPPPPPVEAPKPADKVLVGAGR